MIDKTKDYSNKTQFYNKWINKLPFFMVENENIFEIKYMTKANFRTSSPLFYETSRAGNKYPVFANPGGVYPINTNQVICTTKEEAKDYLIREKVDEIKMLFPDIQREYLEYIKFMDAHSEYFV